MPDEKTLEAIRRLFTDTPSFVPVVLILAAILFLFMAAGAELAGRLPKVDKAGRIVTGLAAPILFVIGLVMLSAQSPQPKAITVAPTSVVQVVPTTALAPTALPATATSLALPTTATPTVLLQAESSTRVPPTATRVPPIATATPTLAPQLTRCEIITRDLPQSTQAIAAKFGFSSTRVADLLHENCGTGTIDGFVVRGPPAVTMQVYPGGCIDAPQDATFSAPTVPNGVGGLRAYEGSVKAGDFTYRMFCYR